MLRRFIPKSLKSALRGFLQLHSLQMSQAGQDSWVFGEAFNEKRNGFFLDLGAHDGIYLSNTFLLERRYGWNGICVEANPDSFKKLSHNRNAVCVNVCLYSTEGSISFAKRGVLGGIVSPDMENKDPGHQTGEVITMETKTLESVLSENNAPQEIDYLSIDIEGSEERVLAGFDFNTYRFKCITIERPSELLRTILKNNAYILIKEIPGLDCFYVHLSFLKQYMDNLLSFHEKKHLMIRWR